MASLKILFLIWIYYLASFTETMGSSCRSTMPDLPRGCLCSKYILSNAGSEQFWNITCVNVKQDQISTKLSRIPARNIAYLDYTNTSISEIGVNTLQNYTLLQELLLSHNLINEIEPGTFRMQDELKMLMLDHNHITSIETGSFRGLKSLQILNLGFNSLGNNVDVFEGMMALQKLNLRDNSISSLDAGVFANLKSLKTLILRGNTIKSLSADLLKGLSGLKTLDINENLVEQVELNANEEAPFLEKLYLNDNRLNLNFKNNQLIAISNFQFLKVLGLGGNEMPFVKSTGRFESFRMYQELNISHCNVSIIHNGSLNRIPYLKTLHLHNNPLYCDCKMSWIGQWLNGPEHSLKLTKPGLTTCAFPQYMKGVKIVDTTAEDFICSCESCSRDFSCLGEAGKCSCNSSWTGTSCNEVCTAPAANFQVCSMTAQHCFCSESNSYWYECPRHSHWQRKSCVCDQGFSGNVWQICEDIDECSAHELCDQHAECINTLGSYRCICKTGYSGNGISCKAVGIKGLTQEQKITIGACAGCACLVIVVILVFCCWRMRRKKKKHEVLESQFQLYQGDDAEGMSNPVYTEPLSTPIIGKNWEIPRKRLTIDITKKLGEGAFGIVYEGTLYTDDRLHRVAVKRLKDKSDSKDYKDLVAELKLMQQVGKHPNVVELIGTCSVNGPLYVVMEIMNGGNLLNFLRRSRVSHDSAASMSSVLSTRHIVQIALDVAQGMNHISTKGMVHRDLAARNILLNENNVAKVTDFGLARDIEEEGVYVKTTVSRLPVKWMAPESLQDQIYTSKSDVWSYGILLWEIASLGGSPYPSVPSRLVLNKLLSGYRMEKPPACLDDMYEIMRKCWHIDPTERPSFKDLTHMLQDILDSGAEDENTGEGIYLDSDYIVPTGDDTIIKSDNSAL